MLTLWPAVRLSVLAVLTAPVGAKAPLPPGPLELPLVGSAQFMWAKKWQKLPTTELLTQYR